MSRMFIDVKFVIETIGVERIRTAPLGIVFNLSTPYLTQFETADILIIFFS